MVFAGVGMVALPLDMIREFLGRPKSTISKSEYIKRARGLGVRANGIKASGPRTCVARVAQLANWHTRFPPAAQAEDCAVLSSSLFLQLEELVGSAFHPVLCLFQMAWTPCACQRTALVSSAQLPHHLPGNLLTPKRWSLFPQELAEKLRHEDRENGRGRKWRGNYNKLNAQLVMLENDHNALELVHPQVRPACSSALKLSGVSVWC